MLPAPDSPQRRLDRDAVLALTTYHRTRRASTCFYTLRDNELRSRNVWILQGFAETRLVGAAYSTAVVSVSTLPPCRRVSLKLDCSPCGTISSHSSDGATIWICFVAFFADAEGDLYRSSLGHHDIDGPVVVITGYVFF